MVGHTEKQNSIKSSETGIIASITQTQAGGTPLTTHVNVIGTVATAGNTVTLPKSSETDEVSITNRGANTLQIFPFADDDLGNGTNMPMELEIRETIEFFAEDDLTWIIINNSESFHGSMSEQDNATEFEIHVVDEAHAYHSATLQAGDLGEWTFNAGSAGVLTSILSIADNGSGTILVTTDIAHGGAVDDDVCHTGGTLATANKGFFKILTVPSSTTYTVTSTWSVTGTGFSDRPAYLAVKDIAIGFYYLAWVSTIIIAGSGITLLFDLHDGTSTITDSKSDYTFGSTSKRKQPNGLGEKTIVSEHRVFWTVTNETDATNITAKHYNMRVNHI